MPVFEVSDEELLVGLATFYYWVRIVFCMSLYEVCHVRTNY